MKDQIEEMTKDLFDMECKGMKCDTCDGYCCEYRMQAEALYNAGYRKQSEGEWGFDGMSWTCSECGEYATKGIKTNYCPNCGARMTKGDEWK